MKSSNVICKDYASGPVVVDIYFNLDVSFDLFERWVIDVYFFVSYTNKLHSLALFVNTNIGWVMNDEVVMMGIKLEYHRGNDSRSFAKILLLLEI